MKKNAKKETRHLVASTDAKITVCGRPVWKVLLWAKKGAPKVGEAGVCARCYALDDAKAAKIRKATKAMAAEALEGAAKVIRSTVKRQPALLVLGERMPAFISVTFKGKEYGAEVHKDGTISTPIGDSRRFNSPSRAGKAVAGREVDGWTFWSYLKADGTLEKLDALRKAVA